jgi:hypothetical protein
MMEILFGLIAGGCLASIQIRRIIKGELPLFGLRALSAASEINLDKFDKFMIAIAGIAFTILIALMLTHV